MDDWVAGETLQRGVLNQLTRESNPIELKARRRKLIYVWNYKNWGGAQVYLLAIMKEAKGDWDIVAILPKGSSRDILGFLDQIGIHVEFIDACIDNGPAPSIKRKLERQWRRIRAEIVTFTYLRKFDLSQSILHIDFAPWQSWIFFSVLSLLRANVFVTLHNALPAFPRWRRFLWTVRMQFISRLSGFHIFTSNYHAKENIKDLVTKRFWESIKVTYTCVNPNEIAAALNASFDKKFILKQNSIPNDKFIVLCVGQFIDRKGRWVFLDAAKIISKESDDIVFVWLTPEMPDANDLRQIAGYGLGDKFHLLLSSSVGRTRHEILKFFRIANIFALPSFVDGLPIALLEAMALGVPSISTNVYAIPEAIRHRDTGVLIKAGDAHSLAYEILSLKGDSTLRQNLAEKGRRFVLANFDERVASQIAIAEYKDCFDETT